MLSLPFFAIKRYNRNCQRLVVEKIYQFVGPCFLLKSTRFVRQIVNTSSRLIILVSWTLLCCDCSNCHSVYSTLWPLLQSQQSKVLLRDSRRNFEICYRLRINDSCFPKTWLQTCRQSTLLWDYISPIVEVATPHNGAKYWIIRICIRTWLIVRCMDIEGVISDEYRKSFGSH